MRDTRFSIIIPTRERADTLIHTLKTCVSQEFESFEIVVADNCSSPETKVVVDSFNSKRIKYYRSDTPLSMSDNFERAMMPARGEYFIVLGDDDALLPNALNQLDRLIRTLDAKVLHWEHATYLWPGVRGGWTENILSIPQPRPIRVVNSREIILFTFETTQYMYLPMLYVNAVVHHSLIDLIKQRTGSLYGKSLSPDSYSGVSIAYLCEQYYSIGVPFSVNGVSSKSNGAACLLLKGKDAVAQDYLSLNKGSRRSFHKLLPNLLLSQVAIVNEYLQAQDALFPEDSFLHLDRKKFAIRCIKELEAIKRDDDEWDHAINEIYHSLADVPKIQNWFRKQYMEEYRRPKVERTSAAISNPKDYPSMSSWGISLRGDDFSINNVADAAELCGKFINPNISIEIGHSTFPSAASGGTLRSLYKRARRAAKILIKGE